MIRDWTWKWRRRGAEEKKRKFLDDPDAPLVVFGWVIWMGMGLPLGALAVMVWVKWWLFS